MNQWINQSRWMQISDAINLVRRPINLCLIKDLIVSLLSEELWNGDRAGKKGGVAWNRIWSDTCRHCTPWMYYGAFRFGCPDRMLQPVIANRFIATIVMSFRSSFTLEQNCETLSTGRYSLCRHRARESRYAVSLIAVFIRTRNIR